MALTVTKNTAAHRAVEFPVNSAMPVRAMSDPRIR